MKHIITIASSLLLAVSAFAQPPACNCPDCIAQAKAAAEGKQYTLPGLQGLNQPSTNQLEHAEGDHCSGSKGNHHAAAGQPR